MHEYGIISLIPPLIVVILALLTRLSLEPILAGCLVGYIIIGKEKFIEGFLNSVIKVMQSEDMVWVILVCSLYGAIMQLIIQSGGIQAFSRTISPFITTKKRAYVGIWAFSTLFFIDDYLDALISGTAMRNVTDKLNIPREMLAFLVSSTAVPICVIVPISTWTIFIGKQLETSKIAEVGQGLQSYWHVIPYIIYGWIQYIIVGLVALGVFPIIGGMNKANLRAENEGIIIPPKSENFKTDIVLFDAKKEGSIAYLVVPVVAILFFTVFFGYDPLKGSFTALLITIIYMVLRKVAPLSDLTNAVVDGAKSMLFALILLLFSYVLKNLGDEMGLTQFVIQSVTPIVSKELLAVVIFVSLGAISFATGNSWGLYAIAIPMVAALSKEVGTDIWLCMGAVVSAGAFGAHACFYSDATILASQGTECNNYAHATTQLPFALVSFLLACIIFLIIGFM
jgi:tetracycline resistance efflux pump